MDFQAFVPLFLLLFFVLSFPNLSYSSLLPEKTEGSHLRLKQTSPSTGFDPTRVTQLSWSPRAFFYKGFLTEEECDHLINLARDKMEKSMVADNDSGASVMSEIRTSSGMFLNKKQGSSCPGKLAGVQMAAPHEIQEAEEDCNFVLRFVNVVKLPLSPWIVETRIAAWTFLPEENGEDLQILHYGHGEKYDPHSDYFLDKINQERGGNRIATVLMYLSNVVKGGETIFPNLERKFAQPKDDTWSDCAKNGYAVKPMKGDALLFFSLHPDASVDPKSLHGSCPVIEGEKWSATKWIHVRSFDISAKHITSEECVDEDANCPNWAALGECQKNSFYMVGSNDSYGYCRKSCNEC